MRRMWAAKLGLAAVEATSVLAQGLLDMMGSHPCDYTLTWRQLAQVCAYMHIVELAQVGEYVIGPGDA